MQFAFSKLFLLLAAYSLLAPVMSEARSDEEALAPVMAAYTKADAYIREHRSKADPEKLSELIKWLDTEVQRVANDSECAASTKKAAYQQLLYIYSFGANLEPKRFALHLKELVKVITADYPKTDVAAYGNYLVFDLDLREQGATDELKEAVFAFAKHYPRSRDVGTIASSYVRKLADTDLEEASDTITEFHKAFGKREELEDVAQQIAQIGKIKHFTFTTITGKKIELSHLKGKVVLIDAWATWCGPCVGMTPGLAKLYKHHKEKGLEIIGVSSDEKLGQLETYVKHHEVHWPQVLLPHGSEGRAEFEKHLGFTSSTPSLLVIDKEGKVASLVFNQFEDAKAKVESLLEVKVDAEDETEVEVDVKVKEIKAPKK